MKAIVLEKTFFKFSSSKLIVSEVEKPSPKVNEILIKIKYSGVNFADILTSHGFYSWAPKRPSIMGLEAAGEVVEIGENVTNHKVGDRVFAGMQSGGYAEYATVDARFVFKPPAFYNWEEIVAFGGQWITAWIALHEMARVRPGEILLVHAAAGGVGSAALQLAQVHGMEVYGTCSPFKKEVIQELGATYVSYDNFDNEMKEMNKLPDCVIESIGGDIFKRSFLNLAPMGRLVTIGGTGIKPKNIWNLIELFKIWRKIPRVDMKQVLRDTRGFMGLHVGYLLNYAGKILPIWQNMINVIEKHEMRPIYRKEQIFPMSKAADAHKYMEDRKNIGKIILDPSK